MGRAQRRWAWHRLRPEWADRLVATSGVGRGDIVLDVGAGTGALTAPLVGTGAQVIAVEAHPARAQALRDRFGARVTVVRADASELRLPRQPFHVVANPPFLITSNLLRRLLQPGTRMLSAHLVVQEQAARRWASAEAPGAHRWSRTHIASLGWRLPRSAFSPPPRVPTRVLVIERQPVRQAWRTAERNRLGR